MFIFGKKKLMNLYNTIVKDLEFAEHKVKYYEKREQEERTDDERKIMHDLLEYWLGRATSYLYVKNKLDNIIHKVD